MTVRLSDCFVFACLALCCGLSTGLATQQAHGVTNNGREQRLLLSAPGSRAAPPVDEEARAAIEKQEETIKKGLSETIAKTAQMSPSEMLEEDAQQVLKNFMPGTRPRPHAALHGLFGISFCISLVWLLTYAFLIYENDREEHLDRWKNRERSPRVEDPRIKHVKPDLVLVFHHPDFDYSDTNSEITEGKVRACMVKDERTGYLSRTEKCLAEAATDSNPMQSFVRSAKSMHKKMSDATYASSALSPRPDASESESGHDEEDPAVKTTLGHVRVALLQDICAALPHTGFEIIAFSSIDNDEIFVCVSIENPEVIREELIRGEMKLQLQHKVVEHLHIGQNPEDRESSPPFVSFDVRLPKNVMGPEATDLDFYKTFHGKHDQGSIISGNERIRLIHRHLSSHLNLDAAKQQGILKDWYPVHSTHWLSDLTACWANLEMLKDLTFVQPLTFIHNYFGARIAFLFAWNGTYCKMLCALVPIALLFELVHFLGDFDVVESSGGILCFSVILVIWSKMAFNYWKREEEYFQVLWNLTGKTDFTVRPSFTGVLKQSPEDSNMMSVQYPKEKYWLRQLATWTITLIFCLVDQVCVYIWISLYDGHMDIVASICLALMIQVFTLLFNTIVSAMNDFENHKYQTDYYSSYLKKLFIFQFVNQFSAFFFIAIKQQYTDFGCPNSDCIMLLRNQLSMTLCLLVIMRIFQVALSSVKVKLIMWWELRTLQKELQDSNRELPVRGFVEEQAKYDEFRIREQIEGMVQLVVALGYVLIFGAVAPIIVPLCFLVFSVQFRLTAYMTTRSSRRPLPRRSLGLGAWEGVIHFIMGFGLVFSGFLLVIYGPSFRGTYLLTKVSGLVAYVALMLLAWQVVALICPATSNGAKLLSSRREHVLKKVAQANEEANIAHLKTQNKGRQASPISADKDPRAVPRMSSRMSVTKYDSGLGTPRAEALYGGEILSEHYDKVPHLVDAKLS